jgi:hypothetical protein
VVDPERSAGWRLVAVVLGSVALAVLTGRLGVWFAEAGIDRRENSGFEELGQFFLGLIVAALLAVTVFVTSVVVGVGHAVPPDRRRGTVAAILVAAGAVGAALLWADANTRRVDLDALDPIVPLVVLATAAAAIGAAAGLLPRWPVGVLVAGAAVALGVVVIAVERRADDVTDQERVERFERTGAPLALIDGADLDGDFVGWGEPYVVGGFPPGEDPTDYVTAGYEVGRDGWLMIVFEADPEPFDCGADLCLELGRRPDGAPILGRRDWGSVGGQRVEGDIWVDVEGGQWRVTGWEREDVDPESVVAVLQALEPVDAEAFVAGT